MKNLNYKLFVLTFLFSLSLVLVEKVQAADSLKYIMHSFVKIKTSGGMVIYIDPAMENSFEDSADVVLITHEHGDHNDLKRVNRKQSCTLIRSSDALKSGIYKTFNIGNLTIRSVPAYNSNHSKTNCVGYVLSFPAANGDTIKIYHPGDTGKIDEMADLASENITYAFLPMDGTYTMSPEDATLAAGMINAKHDIPIHTLPGYAGYGDKIVARFTSPNKLVMQPGTTIALTAGSTTSVEEGSILQPKSFGLYQNYPNPFNPQTIISYRLSETGHVLVRVFDSIGREVATIVNKEQPAGQYRINFDGSNLTSGVYIYQLTAGELTSSKKMILTR